MNAPITGAPATLTAAIRGCLLGTAIGDAIGLPTEGLSRPRQTRLFGQVTGYRFLFRRGMVSDDTEHSVLVAQAILGAAGDPNRFTRLLARQMRVWFAMLPAGIGHATLRACLKLTVGFSPDRSGVFSAGNGPAMRAALLGVCFGSEPEKLRDLVRVSSRITHTDPKAEQGALVIALAAYLSATGLLQAHDFVKQLMPLSSNGLDPELQRSIEAACCSATQHMDILDFATSMGLTNGVTGYVCHTVPVALHTCLRHPDDFSAAVFAAVACGGDTDSVAAIVGGIVGAGVGVAGIPAEWRDGLTEWPRSTAWMERLANRVGEVIASGHSERPLPVFLPAVALRNLFFLIVVLYHGARRLLPPY